MWGTSSPGDKLTGDFGNEPDATSISDRGLFRLLAGNLSPGVFRLLQHNLPITGREQMQQKTLYSITSSARASSDGGTSRPSALAVLRLITSSNLVGCWTGKIGGLLALENAVDVAGRTPVLSPWDRARRISGPRR